MGTRQQNERKFGQWDSLPNGARHYWVEVLGRHCWRAKYPKEVDADEVTVRFWQEIYNDQGELFEVHEKYPIDRGHEKV